MVYLSIYHIYEKQKLYERRTPRKSFSSEDEWTSPAAVKIKLRELLFSLHRSSSISLLIYHSDRKFVRNFFNLAEGHPLPDGAPNSPPSIAEVRRRKG